MKFAHIKAHEAQFPVAVQCRTLGVSRQGYYDWRDREPSARRVRRDTLAARARVVFDEHRGRYGSPRVHAELVRAGESVCVNTVADLMRERELRARRKPRYVPRTTDSRHDNPISPDRLERDFKADAPDRKWCCDITYIPTGEGWLYVAAVMDLCSRRIVGWAMAEHMRAELCGDALKMAVEHRSPPAGLVHHSDRGVQYAAGEYRGLLEAHELLASMSSKGDCYDNAAMESFWATLKTELVHHERYETRAEARASIFEYVEVYYNRKRLHSALGYKSPASFEADLN